MSLVPTIAPEVYARTVFAPLTADDYRRMAERDAATAREYREEATEERRLAAGAEHVEDRSQRLDTAARLQARADRWQARSDRHAASAAALLAPTA